MHTVSIKLAVTPEQSEQLVALTERFADVCNFISQIALEHQCDRRYALHHLAYYPARGAFALPAQMVCNAIRKVSASYQSAGGFDRQATFRRTASVHYDKRTYRIKAETISLTTLGKRLVVPMVLGAHQRRYLAEGTPKEAELIYRGGDWFFNLVLETADAVACASTKVLGVDVGENNLAATNDGLIFGGERTRHERYTHIALRKRLQANGSPSAKQLLGKVSGKESRRMANINHTVSRRIVNHAIATECGVIALEELTDIRTRIKAGKRVRARLHSWAFRQLQDFIAYKAKGAGLKVVFVDPAYTSQDCNACGARGQRSKHRFTCDCGNRAHSDVNAASNIAQLAACAQAATGLGNGSACRSL